MSFNDIILFVVAVALFWFTLTMLAVTVRLLSDSGPRPRQFYGTSSYILAAIFVATLVVKFLAAYLPIFTHVDDSTKDERDILTLSAFVKNDFESTNFLKSNIKIKAGAVGPGSLNSALIVAGQVPSFMLSNKPNEILGTSGQPITIDPISFDVTSYPLIASNQGFQIQYQSVPTDLCIHLVAKWSNWSNSRAFPTRLSRDVFVNGKSVLFQLTSRTNRSLVRAYCRESASVPVTFVFSLY